MTTATRSCRASAKHFPGVKKITHFAASPTKFESSPSFFGANMSVGYFVGPIFRFEVRNPWPVFLGWVVFCAGRIASDKICGSFAEAASLLESLAPRINDTASTSPQPSLIELFPPEYADFTEEQLKHLRIGHRETPPELEVESNMDSPRA